MEDGIVPRFLQKRTGSLLKPYCLRLRQRPQIHDLVSMVTHSLVTLLRQPIIYYVLKWKFGTIVVFIGALDYQLNCNCSFFRERMIRFFQISLRNFQDKPFHSLQNPTQATRMQKQPSFHNMPPDRAQLPVHKRRRVTISVKLEMRVSRCLNGAIPDQLG